MQTVSILDLRERPSNPSPISHSTSGFDLSGPFSSISGLANIHAALKQVDHALYFLWSILYCVWPAHVPLAVGPRGKDNCLSCLALVPAPSRNPGVFNAIDTTLLSAFLFCGLLLLVEAETRIFLHLRVTTSSVLLFFSGQSFNSLSRSYAVSLFLLRCVAPVVLSC